MAELKSTDIASELSSAMAERRLVRLTTRYDPAVVRGYVAGIGPGFVMISVVNDRIWFDGFECFRRPDIIAIEHDPHPAFIETALARRAEVAPEAPAVSLASIEELLDTAGRAFRLITIHCEELDPEVCYIGNVREIADGQLVMREVTPAAEWDAQLERHRTRDITRVSFGADYEAALSLVAEAPQQAEPLGASPMSRKPTRTAPSAIWPAWPWPPAWLLRPPSVLRPPSPSGSLWA